MLNAIKRNVFKFVFRLFVLVYSQVYAWPCLLPGSFHLENKTDLELPISIFSVKIRQIIQILKLLSIQNNSINCSVSTKKFCVVPNLTARWRWRIFSIFFCMSETARHTSAAFSRNIFQIVVLLMWSRSSCHSLISASLLPASDGDNLKNSRYWLSIFFLDIYRYSGVGI